MSSMESAGTLRAQAMLGNDDVLLRTCEFLGPRHTCLGLGASCRALRRLSKSNALWRAFWGSRCLFPREEERKDPSGDGGAGDDVACHKAALVFRRAIHEMNLRDKIHARHLHTRKQKPSSVERAFQAEGQQMELDEDSTLLYSAYIQTHSMMKLAHLRLEPFGCRRHQIEASNLGRPSCSQTWPGQLSDVVNINIPGDNFLGYRVACLNPAEAWCDHPACERARCGPAGCLRCYRFAPRDYSVSVGGPPLRECSERSYDSVTFVKCSFCSVSFCNEHVNSNYAQRYCDDEKGRLGNTPWYKCDECQLSSCPDCVSQVFSSFQDMDRCKVVTAGRECRRKVCVNCIWYVGKEKQHAAGNIPGGDYGGGESQIVVRRGPAAKGQEQEWEDVETCCSKCVRHVEFRWKELARVQDAFGLWNIMP